MSRTLSTGAVVGAMLALAALACAFPGSGGTPEPPATTPPPDVTEEPASGEPGEPTPVKDPMIDQPATAQPATGQPATAGPTPPGVLPAPLYFIRDDGQVWRFEVDGVTLTKITSEPEPVEYLGISPTDGRLAYVTSNDLILTDSLGGNRSVLVSMPDVADGDYERQINASLSLPVWSPDGQKLAYGLGGINIHDFTTGTSSLVLASSPYPDLEADLPEGPIRFFFPTVFSSDGARLLLDYGLFPEAGGLMILNLADNTFVEVTSPDGLACCNPSWANDSASVYFASPVFGFLQSGLWQANALTGTGVALVPGFDDPTWSLVSHPQQLADGQLYTFFGTTTEEFPADRPALTLTRSAPDGVTGRTALRTDTYYPGGVLWDAGGSGAVITDFTTTTNYEHGPLLWLPADGSPALPLGVTATTVLRWGQ